MPVFLAEIHQAVNFSRSQYASAIYAQYLLYYSDINNKIHTIDTMYPAGTAPTNVQADRKALITLQQSLYAVYQTAYNDPASTLESYQKASQPIITQVASYYADATGGSSTIQQKIQTDYTNAQTAVANLQNEINSDSVSVTALLSALSNLHTTIDTLQQEINNLPSGANKVKAEQDLQTTSIDLTTLDQQVHDAQTQFSHFQAVVSPLIQTGGALDQLKNLAAKSNPQQTDLDFANGLLAQIQATETNHIAIQNTISFAKSTAGKVNTDIQIVQQDLNITPPAPVPGMIERGAWYIDWTSWFNGPPFNIPSDVNVINVFVGQITYGADGKPTLDGFGNLTSELDDFAKYCHAQVPPIAVKVSIGGSGGMYDRCWDRLTPTNVHDFAQGMADFCHKHGLDGIDFDYEEFASAEQEALVGNLIKQFKQIDPKFQTSLCTNAGFGPNFPWQQAVKTILDAALIGPGNCAVDRVYIMSYYDPLPTEQNWVLGWADWLIKNYGFTRSRVAVGIDDFDAHAYNPVDFRNWALSQGFSVEHWAYDPARP